MEFLKRFVESVQAKFDAFVSNPFLLLGSILIILFVIEKAMLPKKRKDSIKSVGRRFWSMKKSKPVILKEKGDNYERAVGHEFERRGYRVSYNGLEKGRADGGIDLFAFTKKEFILIQCKNQRDDVQQHIIRKFLGDCAVWESENRDKIHGRRIKRFFIASAPLSLSGQLYLARHTQARFFQMKFKGV